MAVWQEERSTAAAGERAPVCRKFFIELIRPSPHAKDAMALVRGFKDDPNVIVLGTMQVHSDRKSEPNDFAKDLQFTYPIIENRSVDIVSITVGRNVAVFDKQGALCYNGRLKQEAGAAIRKALRGGSSLR